MKSIVLSVLLGAGVVGFVAWRVVVVMTAEAPQYEIVEDSSGSHGSPCDAVGGLVAHIFALPGAAPASALTVLVLGDQSTANEPRRIGTYPIPEDRRIAEGARELAQHRKTIIDGIKKACQAIPQTRISPIYLGVKQGLADLRARGCNARSHCMLFVDSDLEENVEPGIKARLSGQIRRAPALAPRIGNIGIDVEFCGFGVAVGQSVSPSGKMVAAVLPRNAIQEERVQRTWRSIFTKPETVTFEPYCPVPLGM